MAGLKHRLEILAKNRVRNTTETNPYEIKRENKMYIFLGGLLLIGTLLCSHFKREEQQVKFLLKN